MVKGSKFYDKYDNCMSHRSSVDSTLTGSSFTFENFFNAAGGSLTAPFPGIIPIPPPWWIPGSNWKKAINS